MPWKNYVTLFSFLLVISLVGLTQSDSLRIIQLLDSAIYHPQKKDFYLKQVAKMEQKKDPLFQATSWLLRAKYEIRSGNSDAAQLLINKGLKKCRGNKKIQGDFMSLQGSIHATHGNFKKAIKSYQYALRLYDELHLKREAAFVKNNIANVFFNLNDFQSANQYASESFVVIYEMNDTIYYPQIAAILAISESKIGKIAAAKKHAKIAVDTGTKYKLPLAIVAGKLAEAEITFTEEKWQESLVQFQEVVTLSLTYRLLNFETYGRIGLLKAYNQLGFYELATKEGERILELNTILNLHYADYTVYQQLSESLFHTGNTKQAYLYLKKANEIYREYSSLENKKTIQELLTKYQAEKKERELSRKELQLARAFNWILLLGFVVLFLAFGFIWYRKRQTNRLQHLRLQSERNQLEAFIEGEERERERLAAEIHDGIASTLTGLYLQMNNLESIDDLPKLASNLQDVRNEVRHISKNILPFNLRETGWSTAFEHFLSSVNSETFTVHFLPNFANKQLANERGMVVYRILQELIQNTIKHAQASECEIIIFEENKQLEIHYSDNGTGVSIETLKKGNGWNSILKRLEAINASYHLPANPLGGFKLDIVLPKL